MDSVSYTSCTNIVKMLEKEISLCNGTHEWRSIGFLHTYCGFMKEFEKEGGNYSKPMLWIGIYIAVASMFCILPMVADLLHGLRDKKFWFPCKYFTLNAASITVITIAMKLPVDLNNPMPGWVDQYAKLGSMAFMCTMMANLMPSLASMDDKELFANVIGLIILVVTIVVNVLIQVKTGIVRLHLFAYVYVVIMLYLLIISTSFALTTSTVKEILEFKYQVAHKQASKKEHPRPTKMFSVKKIIQHVTRCWVMAGTSSPQFVMASTPLCSTVGVICVSSTLIHFYAVVTAMKVEGGLYAKCISDYKWSLLVVFITQSVGIVFGTIAPIFRCFATLSFKLSFKWIRNHVKVYKVEKYWTGKLLEWKQIHLSFPSGHHRSKTLVHNSKNLILSLCIEFQKVIVASCKMIGLIPIGVVIFVMYCSYCWKSLKEMFIGTPIASSPNTIQKLDRKEDISSYALKLQNEMELSKRTLNGISNLMDRLVQKAEKKSPDNILDLLYKSAGFEGVENFVSEQVQPLPCDEFVNSWSLPVVTLTCIAITFPNIPKDMVDDLFRKVSEGISYTYLIDETFNGEAKLVNIQKATMTLWHEVEDNNTWLENTLLRNSFKGKTLRGIVEWFVDKSKEIAGKINRITDEEPLERHKLIAACSMYRIAKTIMVNHENTIEQSDEMKLFYQISGMIADIITACLTNLPQVIEIKCHESVIEKREASVEVAVMILGRAKRILKELQTRKPPRLDSDQMAFIDEWRVHLKQSIA